MTTQLDDLIRYEGRDYSASCDPLAQHPEAHRLDFSHFGCPPTNCWRGYVCRWAVDALKLWLVEIQIPYGARTEEGGPAVANLAEVFPGTRGRVYAEWFTGSISLPEGELLPPERQLMFASPFYQWSRLLQFERGSLIGTDLRDNR